MLFKRLKDKQDGFTLIELVVVVSIIGVLVAVAVPTYNQITTNAKQKAHEANIKIIEGAATLYIADNGTEEVNLENLIPNYLNADPIFPFDKTKSYEVKYENNKIEVEPPLDYDASTEGD